MNVESIVKDWLTTHGYDGLCCEDCGCAADNPMPCEEGYGKCVAAYKTRDDDGLLIFVPEKPTSEEAE